MTDLTPEQLMARIQADIGAISDWHVDEATGPLLLSLTAQAIEITALEARITDLEARLEPAPIVYGSSGGPSAATQAWTRDNLAPQMVRTYQEWQMRLWPDTPQLYSRKFDETALINREQPTLDAAVATFRRLPDISGQWVCLNHERNNDGTPPERYQAAWAVFLDAVVPAVNEGRAHPVRTVAVTTGFVDPAKVEPWYVAGADAIGADPYSTRAVQTLIDYAASKGRPWAVCEYGFSTDGLPELDDAACQARLATDRALWEAAEVPPLFVLYFNANHNALTGGQYERPQTAAAWLDLTAGVAR